MKIAVAQMSTRAGDFAQTVRRMVEYSRRAADEGADLLVFPMATLSGATPVTPVDREGFLLDLSDCVASLVEEAACPCLVPVLADVDGRATPDALLLTGDEVVPVGLSARLGSPGQEEEPAAAGTLPELEFGGARLGVAFTYDDLDVYDEYDYDVDVILFLSGYGFAVDDPSSALGSSLTEGRFLADAEATGAWIVGVGSLGCYDSQVFTGSSFVLAPWGELAAQAPSLEEALLFCDVDPSAEGPLADPLVPEVYDAPLMAWGALSMGLEQTIAQLGAPGACLVVDGRLPSMLAAALATDSLGPGRVRAVVLQSLDTRASSAAVDLVRALRLPEANLEVLDQRAEKDLRLADDRAQARLAALARETGFLPLGCADKTGRALEEPPGTSAARLLPLGDLYRSDLLSLAYLRNTISPVIPPSGPVADLVPGIEGLDEVIGSAEARLEFVDLVLSSFLEWELPVSDIAAERGHAELVVAVIERLRAREALRGVRPLQLTVSSRTLDEARSPTGLVWRDRVRAEEERISGRLAAFGEALATVSGSPEPSAGERASDADREREVRDLLGYLRDFSAGGGFSPLGEAPSRHGGERGGEGFDGPAGGLWEGPFSEN